eukprot:1153494-Pelagomonas_calceolata.AAC.1
MPKAAPGPQLKLQPLSFVAEASDLNPAALSRPSQACQGQGIQEGAARKAKRFSGLLGIACR